MCSICFSGCKTFFSLKDYDEKPEASKCGTCRRRGRDNYHNKKKKRCGQAEAETDTGDDTNYKFAPQEFCSLVNTMTEEDDEIIDVHTLLEYASYEYDGRALEDFSCCEAEPMYVTSHVDDDDLSVTNDSDEDKAMTELFTTTWLPSYLSPPTQHHAK